MTWPLTFYVKSLPPNTGGETAGPVIRILEKYKDDRGIYEHELTHVMQWFYWSALSLPIYYALHHFNRFDLLALCAIPFGLHAALYKFVPSYRLWAEVQAYKEQAKHYTDDRKPVFAKFISTLYNLKITPEQALQLLRR